MVNFPPSLKLNRRNFGKLLRKSGETVLLCDQFYTVQVTRTTLLKVVFSSFNFACSLSPPCSPSIPKPTRKRRMDFTTWFSNKCSYGVMCPWPLATSSRRQTFISSSTFSGDLRECPHSRRYCVRRCPCNPHTMSLACCIDRLSEEHHRKDQNSAGK